MAYQLTHQKYLSDDEAKALDITLNRFLYHPHGTYEFRDVTIILLLLATGARASEVLNLRPKDLSIPNESVFLRGLKNSFDREIPLPRELFSRVLKLCAAPLGAEERIFPIALRTLQNIWHQYRPSPQKGIHSLRHTFALNLYRKTKDIRLTQMALGHKSIMNTMIYADYTYKVEEFRKALVG